MPTSSDIYVVPTEKIMLPPIPAPTQQNAINSYNNTSYSQSPNAVKLLNPITNNNGKIKLYTEINSNIRVGDRVFIMYNQTGVTTTHTDGIILDNFLEFSGCTNYIYLPQLQGYKVLEINEKNNEITIDRYYDSRFVGKNIYDHYIAEIYINNFNIEGGEMDGTEIRVANFNNATNSSIDINLIQSIVFSGNSFFLRYEDKYDSLYVTTNSSLNTGITLSTYKPYTYMGSKILNQDPTPTASYYTSNNNGYGYNYIFNNHLYDCRIDNGYYENCNLNDCIINGGIFYNCLVSGATINGGTFNNTYISSDSYWFYAIWSGGTFTQDIWYDGIWNGGDFIGKEWRNGTFNNGNFSGSTWRNGLFQGGIMNSSTWSGGTFSNGSINNSIWLNGNFNGGNMTQCTWYDGNCNGGTLLNTNWTTGNFNGGTFSNGIWANGFFNNGNFLSSYWNGGTFNNGIFNSNNNASSISGGTLTYTPLINYWKDGVFNNGTFSNSVWSGGTFNNGNFADSSLWSGGTFNYGNFTNSSWLNGNFINGMVTNSYFHNVNWTTGVWNSGTLGVTLNTSDYPVLSWSGGTFNAGVFGDKSSTNAYWWNGDFYGGTFFCDFTGCPSPSANCGFFNGTFHGGDFRGILRGGVWITGTFNGCNMTYILTNSAIQININPRPTRRYGELPLKNNNQNMSNL